MSKEVEVIKPQAASDAEVVKAFRSAMDAEKELVQSPLFKSFTRRAVISGLMLLEKKTEVGHGNWIAWMARNEVEPRTAQRHMEGGSSWCGLLQIRHDVVFDGLPVSQVLTLPAASLPESAKPVREKGDQIIDTKTVREINLEFEEAEGSKREIHDIKFHCPHCGAKNKGKFGRTIKCANEQCGKKIKVQPDGPTPEEKIKAIVEGEQEIVSDLLGKLEQWRSREHRAEAGRDLLQQLSDSLVEAGKETKKLLKAAKAKKK